jgi:uncharacterized membrane protein YgcG
MRSKSFESGCGRRSFRRLVAILSVTFLASGSPIALAQETQPQPQNSPPAAEAPKIPNDQLDSLVAPIALYPDPLLAQTLAASTYPLEIIQLQQWMGKNKTLKDKALTDAVQKQTWDPSVQAMAALPDVVKLLADSIAWTSDLGNAFLAQQADVMDAVQRMRAKANSAGKLKTSQEQKVETKQVEGKTVVVIEQANPKVVYVPSYDPTVVYGPPVYPYPPVYYPTGRLLAFGAGVAIGAAWNNGGWGYNCGWGNNNVNVNVNNNFVNNYNKTNVNNINNVNRNNINNVKGSGNTWQHDSQHRGGAPYSSKATAQKYGGTTRTNQAANRPSNVNQRPSQPNSVRQQPAASDRSTANRPSNQPQNRMSGGGDSIGNRQVSKTPSARNTSAFGGASGGMNRSSASASHSRGSSSMGGSRGGGSRGGGRSGGGRRR